MKRRRQPIWTLDHGSISDLDPEFNCRTVPGDLIALQCDAISAALLAKLHPAACPSGANGRNAAAVRR